MKSCFFIALLAIISSNQVYALDTLPIVTTSGQTVQVSPNSLLAAYKKFIENKGINTVVNNSDGSKTIFNPRVLFAGEIVRIYDFVGGNPMWSSDAICKINSLGKDRFFENEKIVGSKYVRVDHFGNIVGNGVIHEGLLEDTVSSVTCDAK